MAGYIALTTSEWVDCIKAFHHKSAVFWRKRSVFKALQPGEPFYFLRRGKFSSNDERFLAGKGLFVDFEELEVCDAWKKYNTKLGFPSKELFDAQVKNLYNNDVHKIGCIYLSDVFFFDNECSLADCNVDFSPYIVSGKAISDEVCSKIDELGNRRP